MKPLQVAGLPATRGVVASWMALGPCALVLALLVSTATAVGLGPWRAFGLLLFAPVVEEAIFRAGLQESLLWSTRYRGFANGATAVVFGVVHALVRADASALAVAVPALLTGVVYERTGQLRLCIVLHAVMNAAWLVWSLQRTSTFFHL